MDAQLCGGAGCVLLGETPPLIPCLLLSKYPLIPSTTVCRYSSYLKRVLKAHAPLTTIVKGLLKGPPELVIGWGFCLRLPQGEIHMGGNLLTVRSLISVSYFLYFWAPFFGNLEVCDVKTCNFFWKYMSATWSTCLCLDHSSIGGLFNCPCILRPYMGIKCMGN